MTTARFNRARGLKGRHGDKKAGSLRPEKYAGDNGVLIAVYEDENAGKNLQATWPLAEQTNRVNLSRIYTATRSYKT